ncbi:hotdog fold thioesterase [Pyrobaculum aerophilum]|uniref:Phenylacetic acid degradation protein PaaD n=1 Tax=Pyrobaculum aerophilum TaxID=13773 RepID=A0A371R768_9CREN|nr:hotdog fold thioesterase [Pyrobaculum aerophilum]RFA96236.1 phenylacetic acid degradation protein PaaD [Pyrobaculum aerophilum]RFB00385.1 phenylacetic acid degradation protein PaaD [Pyrobaculum aerophilum]
MNLPIDEYTKLIGAEVREVRPGYAVVYAKAPKSACNFNGVIHGGFIFSLADIAFAYASNAGGRMALALDMYVSFRKALKPDKSVVATAKELQRSGRTALYLIEVTSEGDLIALITATVYVLDREPGAPCD